MRLSSLSVVLTQFVTILFDVHQNMCYDVDHFRFLGDPTHVRNASVICSKYHSVKTRHI